MIVLFITDVPKYLNFCLIFEVYYNFVRHSGDEK